MAQHGDRSTLYLRGMPRALVREAKAHAARRGATLTRLVADALARSLEPDAPPDDDLGAAMAWYARNETSVLRRHRGEFVAIVDDRVLDHDTDFAALAERVFRAVGERAVYMPEVGAEPPIARVRSPRVVR